MCSESPGDPRRVRFLGSRAWTPNLKEKGSEEQLPALDPCPAGWRARAGRGDQCAEGCTDGVLASNLFQHGGSSGYGMCTAGRLRRRVCKLRGSHSRCCLHVTRPPDAKSLDTYSHEWWMANDYLAFRVSTY